MKPGSFVAGFTARDEAAAIEDFQNSRIGGEEIHARMCYACEHIEAKRPRTGCFFDGRCRAWEGM